LLSFVSFFGNLGLNTGGDKTCLIAEERVWNFRNRYLVLGLEIFLGRADAREKKGLEGLSFDIHVAGASSESRHCGAWEKILEGRSLFEIETRGSRFFQTFQDISGLWAFTLCRSCWLRFLVLSLSFGFGLGSLRLGGGETNECRHVRVELLRESRARRLLFTEDFLCSDRNKFEQAIELVFVHI